MVYAGCLLLACSVDCISQGHFHWYVFHLQDADAQVVGIASLPIPNAQQVAVVVLDSQGLLHLCFTPMSTDWEVAHAAAGLAGTGQQGRTATALSASRGAALSQDQQGGVENAGTGEPASCCPMAVHKLVRVCGLRCCEVPDLGVPAHNCFIPDTTRSV